MAFRAVGQSILKKSPNDVVFLSAVRSPITKAFKGGFKDAWPEDILRPVMREATRRANIQPGDVQDVLIGNVLAELGFSKTGRMALNDCGFPVSTTFHTVNRQCSSSLQAITHQAHAILAGQIDVALAGGVESMSKNYASRGRPTDVSPSLQASTVKHATDCLLPMGITSENVARRYAVSREDQDDYAFLSHQRAEAAQAAGKFDSEIVPVTYSSPVEIDGTKQTTRFTISRDDTIRPGVKREKLGTLKPAFAEDGASTAGNSSQISDGASSVILARRSWADSRGLRPIGRFAGTQVLGCEPDEMGVGPALAIPALLRYAGVELKDIDVLEINEAFASQVLYVLRALGLDVDKVNPNGGAIALGHPTAATGARQAATLLAELERSDRELGIVSMCTRGDVRPGI
ncbi:3-ketoacyl-CoA thiolase [Verticillium dahliae VdLs.17]|uniref:3-ketoacyl-CoA thiolase n=1 Tax=Verticillium dahliae (strain VdLs.17 / ATCC MYA-4575 / FGSC 10137) TaxID=498257 RepID=G2XDB4_VERDV|nr:3-ketoacyl-CoA thiolase [Verticillium dahliae VdLs.17]EGY16982.1 3-ketoacyl-CoA thiolase [Verticillium dahliae VdLs.17]